VVKLHVCFEHFKNAMKKKTACSLFQLAAGCAPRSGMDSIMAARKCLQTALSVNTVGF